ncbi:glycosyltransferase [Curtobacterium sp. Csp1]|uniref:glycosyltransferase family 2 protein n=1 Tax=Curtobacterium sp. Csp1 TaxID=2495429 RepID=UPI001597E62E|nr:glycosyltransferase [Curtobacterium sp. Csp1]QKS21851.1 glycosyltransferase [Curtobacterium sp. Csp1]
MHADLSHDTRRVVCVLATRDGGDLLRRQLESMAEQTVSLDELVVLDDGSSAATRQVIAAAADRLPVRVVAASTPGVPGDALLARIGQNFAAALRHARIGASDVVLFADQDDVWLPDRIERQVAQVVRNDALAVASDARLIDGSGDPLPGLLSDLYPRPDRFADRTRDAQLHAVIRTPVATGAAMAVSGALVRTAPSVPTGWLHDRWYSLCAAAAGALVLDDGPVIEYRLHVDQAVGATRWSSHRGPASAAGDRPTRRVASVDLPEAVRRRRSTGQVGRPVTAVQRAGILVTVATFRRPDGLVALLRSLERMVDAPPFDVLVVDNDPRHSATPAVDGVRGELGFPVRLVAEPAPGIAAARNAALRAADTYRWVCFVDDDEEVDPGWLLRLTDVRRRSDADGVTGPVEFSFAVDPPRWALLGNFFIRPDFADGAPCPTAATNNLLLSVDALRARDLRFDLRLGTTGGSDIMLTRQLTSRGGRIVWCEGAVVHEGSSGGPSAAATPKPSWHSPGALRGPARRSRAHRRRLRPAGHCAAGQPPAARCRGAAHPAPRDRGRGSVVGPAGPRVRTPGAAGTPVTSRPCDGVEWAGPGSGTCPSKTSRATPNTSRAWSPMPRRPSPHSPRSPGTSPGSPNGR